MFGDLIERAGATKEKTRAALQTQPRLEDGALYRHPERIPQSREESKDSNLPEKKAVL